MVYEYCYREEIAKTVKLLDKINMSILFQYNMTPWELADRIQNHIEADPKLVAELDNDYFKGDIMNQIDEWDLMDYVKANYGVKFTEVVEYRLI